MKKGSIQSIKYKQPTPALYECFLRCKIFHLIGLKYEKLFTAKTYQNFVTIDQFLHDLQLKQLFKILMQPYRNYLTIIFSVHIKVFTPKTYPNFLTN